MYWATQDQVTFFFIYIISTARLSGFTSQSQHVLHKLMKVMVFGHLEYYCFLVEQVNTTQQSIINYASKRQDTCNTPFRAFISSFFCEQLRHNSKTKQQSNVFFCGIIVDVTITSIISPFSDAFITSQLKCLTPQMVIRLSSHYPIISHNSSRYFHNSTRCHFTC